MKLEELYAALCNDNPFVRRRFGIRADKPQALPPLRLFTREEGAEVMARVHGLIEGNMSREQIPPFYEVLEEKNAAILKLSHILFREDMVPDVVATMHPDSIRQLANDSEEFAQEISPETQREDPQEQLARGWETIGDARKNGCIEEKLLARLLEIALLEHFQAQERASSGWSR